MAAPLAGLRLEAAGGEVVAIGWPEYLAYLRGLGLPPGLLAGVGPGVFRAVGVRDGGATVATGLAHDRDGDCGIFNISTLPSARRRGHATAVTAALLHAARERGCVTASLQATPMAERLYARLGFRRLGRILEHTVIRRAAGAAPRS
jgi:ribosomal protein S18 acetylase RimI-like enzyme